MKRTVDLENFSVSPNPAEGKWPDGVTITVKAIGGDVIDVTMPRAMALMMQVDLDIVIKTGKRHGEQ